VYFIGFTEDGKLKGRRESPMSVSVVTFRFDQLVGRARDLDYSQDEVLSESGSGISCKDCGHLTVGSQLSDTEKEFRYCPVCEKHYRLF